MLVTVIVYVAMLVVGVLVGAAGGLWMADSGGSNSGADGLGAAFVTIIGGAIVGGICGIIAAYFIRA